ncbi:MULTISPECIES: phage tail protein [Streptomyces]|uniref:Phage tail protein n=2 Tax=Streptomyces TaxID=1883 RepID=A0A3S5ILE5_9ACTN|nr:MULTISPECIES: phage tail protein [Streptomyces]KNE78756.1 tail protein [Streptomyces fradiae]OFA33959.1 phage tail protein [Streptomyces fradiae]PQM22960.1 phage tail protein [Streptomyces xinghaiensis]RKM97434.1 phage tail protein [Streptomyces xinghaiensis]RNC73732.1 phage tail protein [Streptomyces xinghaiensis]
MRGSIDGLGSAQPLGLMLPALFADDELAQRFTAGLDEVLAPFLNVLDCLEAYFDPSLAPLDFTAWLGGWVGAETEQDTAAGASSGGPPPAGAPAHAAGAGAAAGTGADVPAEPPLDGPAEARLREAVAVAATLHRLRGTRRGLATAVRLVFGVEPEITESGAASWAERPLGAVPGERRPRLHVSIRLPEPDPGAEPRLDELVAAARPAHMPYTVTVTVAERTTRT